MAVEPAFLALLGPSRCVGCAVAGGLLCDRCAHGLRRPQRRDAVDGVDRVVAAWEYEKEARSLILGLKLGGRREAASPIVKALEAEARRQGLEARLVTWVPARRRDARTRGFDHAELIARALAARLGLPARSLLRRTGPARPDQASLSAAQRRANLKGAFVAAAAVPAPVCLVDDLLTTGATAAACAAALRRSGASLVELAVACRSS